MHEKKYFERQLGNMAKRLRQISQKQDIFIPLLWHPVSSCIYVVHLVHSKFSLLPLSPEGEYQTLKLCSP